MYRENISGVFFPHLHCPRFRNACFSNYSVDHSSLAYKVNAVTFNLMASATNDARLISQFVHVIHVITRINHFVFADSTPGQWDPPWPVRHQQQLWLWVPAAGQQPGEAHQVTPSLVPAWCGQTGGCPDPAHEGDWGKEFSFISDRMQTIWLSMQWKINKGYFRTSLWEDAARGRRAQPCQWSLAMTMALWWTTS